MRFSRIRGQFNLIAEFFAIVMAVLLAPLQMRAPPDRTHPLRRATEALLRFLFTTFGAGSLANKRPACPRGSAFNDIGSAGGAIPSRGSPSPVSVAAIVLSAA